MHSAFLISCATAPTPSPLTPPNTPALWFLLAEEEDGRVIAAHNADKLMVPASNRKVFASATIANCLGLDTRLVTEFWRDGEDLVIVGDGDPSLGSWRYERSEDFNEIADLLLSRGVTRVRDVVADVSRFDRVTRPYAWKQGYLLDDYAAPVDALVWGESEIADNKTVPDSGLHAANAMREALHSRGIAVTGVARLQTERRAWQEKIAEMPSPFVAQLLTTVLKNSHNLYTEMLFKRSTDGSYATSFARERAFATTEAQVAPNEFHFVDGSGLAPDNLVSPRAMIRMLRWMNHPSRRGYWWATLAQPANEGTLRRRLVSLEHRMRGKTGTVFGVIALSGIVAMPDGRFRYFSMAVNHHTGSDDEAQKAIDALVERLAQ